VVAADANDWDSVCTLAQLIMQGRDGLPRAADRARVLLSFLASCGYPRACALLGSLECVHGTVDKGISLLEQAADKGICDAHLELGLHYHAKDPRGQGGGGLTNAEQCMRWFKGAAALGSPRAFFYCGIMHCEPKWEQPQDIALAGMFFIIGRALGDSSSTKAANQLLQKTQKESQQQMVWAQLSRVLSASYASIFQFTLAEAWAARLILPLEAEQQQV
jgi:TPR repeat protein